MPEHVSLAGARGVSRTRAGLGSGLEVVLPTGSAIKDEIWVNVPVVESFARSSPYTLIGGPHDGYTIVDTRSDVTYPVRLPGSRVVQPHDVARRARCAGLACSRARTSELHQSRSAVLELQSPAQLPLLHDGSNVGQNEVSDKASRTSSRRAAPPRRNSARRSCTSTVDITGHEICDHRALRPGRQGTGRRARRGETDARARFQRLRSPDRAGVDHLSFASSSTIRSVSRGSSRKARRG